MLQGEEGKTYRAIVLQKRGKTSQNCWMVSVFSLPSRPIFTPILWDLNKIHQPYKQHFPGRIHSKDLQGNTSKSGITLNPMWLSMQQILLKPKKKEHDM